MCQVSLADGCGACSGVTGWMKMESIRNTWLFHSVVDWLLSLFTVECLYSKVVAF